MLTSFARELFVKATLSSIREEESSLSRRRRRKSRGGCTNFRRKYLRRTDYPEKTRQSLLCRIAPDTCIRQSLKKLLREGEESIELQFNQINISIFFSYLIKAIFIRDIARSMLTLSFNEIRDASVRIVWDFLFLRRIFHSQRKREKWKRSFPRIRFLNTHTRSIQASAQFASHFRFRCFLRLFLVACSRVC